MHLKELRFSTNYLQMWLWKLIVVRKVLCCVCYLPCYRSLNVVDISLLNETERLYGSGRSGDCDVDKGSCLCFYEVIAERYMQVPDDCKTVLQLFVKLWSQSFASQIFALLFYQWVSFISFLEYDHRKRRNKFYVIFIGKLRLCDIFGKMLRGILY